MIRISKIIPRGLSTGVAVAAAVVVVVVVDILFPKTFT